MGVFKKSTDGLYALVRNIQSDKLLNGCSGLAGSGSNIYAACGNSGLLWFRTA